MNTIEIKPAYKRLKHTLLEQIRSKKLQPGEQLPSFREIAEAAGTSIMPVRQAVEELENEGLIVRYHGKGTFVNSKRKHQAQNGIREIVLVIPGIDENPLFARQARCIHDRCVERGYRQVILSADDYRLESNIIGELSSMNVAGAVIYQPEVPEVAVALRKLQEQKLPFVLQNHWQLPSIVAPRCSTDDFEVGYLAAKHLLELGHRQIGLLIPDSKYETLDPRYHGYLKAIMEFGLSPRQSLVEYPQSILHKPALIVKWSEGATQKLLLEHPEITAFIPMSGRHTALGVCKAVLKTQRRIPQDISIVCVSLYGSYLMSTLDTPKITSVDLHEDIVAKKALDMVIKHIEEGPQVITHQLIPPTFVPGQSTAPPRR
ncbi:MAG: hypothetical protein DRP56_00965 [Planctomycetota bacterium]|nr:MAG: hypothetical protein DRP56_00965 [Planctomycetota bacterium]